MPLGAYAIAQEGRPFEEGIDFWVIYLHFYLTGSGRLPTDRETNTLFVVHDTKVYMPPELRRRLADLPEHVFGPLRVVRLVGAEAAAWRQATRHLSATPARESQNQAHTELP